MRKTLLPLTIVGLLAALLAVGGAGCTVHTRPAVVVEPAPVVVASPPPRVYYSGRWLYYRGDGYYYYSGSRWVVARAVPHHVVRYHHVRPARAYRPTHVHRAAPHRASPPPRHRHYRKAEGDKLPNLVEWSSTYLLPST